MATRRPRKAGSFQIPVPGLFADLEEGDGSVAFNDEFAALDTDVQLSILADWQAGLTDAIRQSLVRYFRAFASHHLDIQLPERLALFRAHCLNIGVSLPGDFVLLLQQD